MDKDTFKGKRAIIVARYSSGPQGQSTTLERQVQMAKDFAEKHGIIVVDEVRLEAMSASLSKQEPHLRKLIVRKRERNDFELVIVYDFSRFARRAVRGYRLMLDFQIAGIKVLSTTDANYSGSLAPVFEVLTFVQNQEFVSKLAVTVSGARVTAIEFGIISPVTNVTMGVDKLFTGPDGDQRFVLRDTHDGFKLRLHPESGALIERIAKRKDEKAVIKKKSERITPIPGDPIHVRAVNNIFRWRLIEKVSPWKICQRLTADGVRSVWGKPWQPSSLRAILENTIYTGTAIGGRETTGAWAQITNEGAKQHSEPRDPPEGRERLPAISKEERLWIKVEYPAMSEFLDPDIRDIAKAWQWNRIARKEDARGVRAVKALNDVGRVSGGNRHDPNLYPLSHLMIAKQGLWVMTGQSTKRRKSGGRFRYYCIARFRSIPVAHDIHRRVIPAEPVEKAVCDALALILEGFTGFDEIVQKHIEIYVQAKGRDQSVLPDLIAERNELEAQRKRLISVMAQLDDETFRTSALEMAEKSKRLSNRIEAASQELAATTEDAKEISANVESQMRQIGEALRKGEVKSIRNLFEVFVSRCEVDLETKNIDIEFAVPGSGLTKASKALSEVCVVGTSATTGAYQPNPLNPIILAKIRLSYHRKVNRGTGSTIWFTSERLQI